MRAECFGAINRTVLSAGAAKRYTKLIKSPGQVVFNRQIDKGENRLQKLRYPGLFLKKTDHGLPFTRPCLIFFKPPRVQQSAAIKDETASVTGLVGRKPFFVGKAVNINF